MLTREAQLKGNKVATQRLREKAINSVGKAFQQAQVKRTLDRLKKNPSFIESVIWIEESVTTETVTSTESVTDNEIQALQAELDKYKVIVDSLNEKNEKLRQVDSGDEALRNELKEILEPYRQLVKENKNLNQPRLKKMVELLQAIEKVL